MTVMWIDKYKDKIIIRDDKDKNKDIKNRNKVESKDKNDIEKNSNYKSKIIDKNDKEKCKNKVIGTKSCDKISGINRYNINTKLSKNDIYKEILNRSEASNKDIGSWD